MSKNKQKSYGERYNNAEFKIKINRKRLIYIVFGLLLLTEVILGVLWAFGL